MAARELNEVEKSVVDKYPALGEILADASLSPHQRKLRALPIIKRARMNLRVDLKEHESKLGTANAKLECLETFVSWCEQFTKGGLKPRLERNDCSRLHTFVTAMQNDRAFLGGGAEIYPDPHSPLYDWSQVQTFVVQHDWARAFANATDYAEGPFNLPYPKCAFEFRISGKNVVVLTGHDEDNVCTGLSAWIECAGSWFCPEDVAENEGAFLLAKQQIRAICIALDAEVASHSVVRAPRKLNVKRERDGKIPLFDYRVVSLSRRVRAQEVPRSASGLSPTRKRLHFRRGHWRHFAEFKTWVRWTLVGDPALGFIDHEYRL